MKLFARFLASSVALVCLSTASAQTLFSDDFEAGIAGWTTAGGASALDLSTAQNIVPAGGQSSALLDSSLDKMYHNLGSELSGQFFLTFYIYDDVATRAFGEARGYSGAGYADGTLQQLYAVGKYSSVTLPGETFDATKYQARVVAGANAGWFNLNAAGAPDRSAGWHRFDIERSADGATLNFYVDGLLGRTITGATDFTMDSVTIGSVAAGSTAGNSYFDGVALAVPEPSLLALLGLAGAALGWRRLRRR